MTDRYTELAPHPALSPWVECAWTVRAPEIPEPERRVLPDGCMDIVWSPRWGLHIVGSQTEAFSAALEPSTTALGVRFHVGAGTALLGLGGGETLDARIEIAHALGEDGDALAERVAACHEPARRTAILLQWVRARARTAPAPDPVVRAVARTLAETPQVGVPQLARRMGLSERQLRRRVVEHVGYGPKRLARVLRLQRALAIARTTDPPDLAGVAYDAGYADQAHFSQDCAALAGRPPSRLLAA